MPEAGVWLFLREYALLSPADYDDCWTVTYPGKKNAHNNASFEKIPESNVETRPH